MRHPSFALQHQWEQLPIKEVVLSGAPPGHPANSYPATGSGSFADLAQHDVGTLADRTIAKH